MVDMKVTEKERNLVIYTRMYRASKKAHKWVYLLAVRFGTEQYIRVQSARFEVRQFFGVQYLVK